MQMKEFSTISEDVVTVNWVFLPRNEPCRMIDIPRGLFEAPSQKLRELFAEELHREYAFKAKINYDFEFHKVVTTLFSLFSACADVLQAIEDIAVNQTVKKDWTPDMEHFELIAPASSLAKALGDKVKNDEPVHLAVSAEENAGAIR